LVVCPPFRSRVNLSRIVRTAGGCGLRRIVCIGSAKVAAKIARDSAETVAIERHRTLSPLLDRLRQDRYRLVGLEQTTGSQNLHHYAFRRRTALIVGNERKGLDDQVLTALDDVVEIPVWGLPFSYNVATATAMALYEYCRQFPRG
jgi:tRNA G18 (ribose-2'-O)-methylase SpoU